jgi:hypothetical protein
MSRTRLFLATLLLGGISGLAPAQAADGPSADAVDGWYRPAGHRVAWEHRHHGYHPRRIAVAEAGEVSVSIPRERFFPGAGGEALHGRGVVVAEYTEAYLPRGVLYNVPGPPVFARTEVVIRAKY